MAELRALHLGAPAPRRSVFNELHAAFESAVKDQVIGKQAATERTSRQ